MKNKIKPRRAIKCLDQNCDFHPKDLAAAMEKQEAAKPSPLPPSPIEEALVIMDPNGPGPFHYKNCAEDRDEGFPCKCDDTAGQVLAAEVRRLRAQEKVVPR